MARGAAAAPPRRRPLPAARRGLLAPLLGAALASAWPPPARGAGSEDGQTLEVAEGEGDDGPSPEDEVCDERMKKLAFPIHGLKGDHYFDGVGLSVSGDKLTLKHNAGTSLLSKCKKHFGPWDLTQLRLVQGSVSFTVDLSRVACACNIAFYLVSAPARDVDGIPISGSSYAPGAYYCDANKIGGQWCPEVDIMEANNHAFQATPHKCDPPVGDRHYNHCDRAGCAQNTKYIDKAYGPGPGFGINTLRPFRVRTEFAGNAGTLTGMTTILQQDDHKVVLDHSNCDAGYLASLSQAMGAGMSLRVTYWGDNASSMAWMDTPPCNGEVCSSDTAGLASISDVVVESAPEVRPTPGPEPKRPDNLFNCSTGLAGWETGWSPLKIAFCCTHGSGVSCATSPRRAGPIRWSNHPDKCLTVARAAGSTPENTDYSLIVWDCEGGTVGASQGFVSRGDGKIRWSAHPHICMDVGHGGTTNGNFVKFTRCSELDSSQQSFTFPSSSTKIRRKESANMCLDLANHSGRNGNRLQLWECLSDDSDQVFSWEVDASGSEPGPPAPPTLPPTLPPAPTTPAPPVTTAAQADVLVSSTQWPALYDCLANRAEVWSYRKRLWCCNHMKQGCPVRIPAIWVYDPVVAYPAHIRVLPKINGARTNDMLKPGDIFRVSQGVEGSDGILYLKLADGRGWFFDRMPGVGVMSVEYRVAKTTTSDFSCAIWYPGIEQSWSKEQQHFCCQQAGRGCPAEHIRSSTPLILHKPMQTAVSQEQYNCNEGYRDAEVSWPFTKQQWCCLHRGIGCTTTTGLMPSSLAGCHKGWWGLGWLIPRKNNCQPRQASFGQAFEQRRPLRRGPGGALQRGALLASCGAGLLGCAALLARRLRRRPPRQEDMPHHMLLEAVD